MKISFSDSELSEIEQMADIKGISVSGLKARYTEIVEGNFWQDMRDALDATENDDE